MDLKNYFPVLILIVALVSAAPAAQDAHPHRYGNTSGEIQLQLNDGEKWAADTPLRKGMGNIHTAMTAALPKMHGDALPASGYQQLAEVIQREVRYMITHCKLPPAADVQLHVLIAALIQAAAAMQGAENRQQGAMQAVHALNAYGEYFAHPGWESLP